jgi:hypothetical protein
LAKAILMAMLLPVAFFQRRRYPKFARYLLMLCMLGVLSSCGAGRTIPTTGTTGGGGTPTPPGTSTLIISGSAAGLTRSVSLTLTVQ